VPRRGGLAHGSLIPAAGAPGRLGHAGHALRRRLREAVHRRGLASAAAYVMEFPRSGGSWVRRMTSDLLVTGEPASATNSVGTLAAARRIAARVADARMTERPYVIRDHWRHGAHLRPAIYVVRDGRDVVVSLYYYHRRELALGGRRAELANDFLRSILGAGYDIEDARANLPAFIASLERRPFGGLLRSSGSRRLLSWPRHVADWMDRPGVLVVKYEDLLADTPGAMRRVARHLNVRISTGALADLVGRHGFEATSGRAPGVESPTSHQRKGVAGDWRRLFTSEAAATFDDFAGDALRALGYDAPPERPLDAGSDRDPAADGGSAADSRTAAR